MNVWTQSPHVPPAAYNLSSGRPPAELLLCPAPSSAGEPSAAWDADIFNSAQLGSQTPEAAFSHTLAAMRPQPGGQEAGLSASRLLCLVSVATESERMQHPDARSGGIPPLTQGRGKRHIADGAKARCRICRESKDGPRIGRPQSSLLLGQLLGGLCQNCAKCCLCLKRPTFL